MMEKSSNHVSAKAEDNTNLKKEEEMPSIVQESKNRKLVVAVKGVVDALSAKAIGKAIGAGAALAARPCLSFYDGMREGFNKKPVERS